MIPTNPILREAFPNWATGKGIFDLMVDPPWGTSPPANVLNISYFGNHSGAKFCSPLVQYLLSDSTLSDQSRQTLVSVIEAKYKVNWTKLWATMIAEYSPITNYDMTEDVTRDLNTTDDETNTKTLGSTVERTNTRNLVDSTEHGKTTSEIDSVQGFNSTEFKPADKSEIDEGGTTSEKHTGTDNVSTTQNDSEQGGKNAKSTEKETITTHRVGNIGVTTNQQLIREERELWVWNYFESVFRDIDKELTLFVYDPCRV